MSARTASRFFALILVACSLVAPAAQAQELGLALYGSGFTGTVWVNSFDRRLDYLAHGLFYPAIPIGALSAADSSQASPLSQDDPIAAWLALERLGAATAGYDVRYGMTLSPASGTVSVDADGYFMATGTATNPNAIAAEGDITINLLRNGSLVDQEEVPFLCGPSATCPWNVHFVVKPTDFPLPPHHHHADSFTVQALRIVKGSRCGGELTPDLNGEPCHSAVAAYFQLPLSYQFTPTDYSDTNYVARPGAATSALCDVILPLCAGKQPPPPPPPGGDPCAVWLAAYQQWLAQMPTPTATGSCADWSRLMLAWVQAMPPAPASCGGITP